MTDKLELASLVNNIEIEFNSLEFQTKFFEAATMNAGSRDTKRGQQMRSKRFSLRRQAVSFESDSSRGGGVMGASPDALPFEHNVGGRIAIFVLGPSAAGKTHRTRANLSQVLFLQANRLPYSCPHYSSSYAPF